MSRHIVLQAAIAAALPLAAATLSGWSPAVAPSRIAGTFTGKYAEQHPVTVSDQEGHALILGRAQGLNRSTGATSYMDQAQVTNVDFVDLTQGNGAHQGYITFVQGGDTVINQWSGKVTTKLSADKTPATSFAGTWITTKGTGRYQGATGKGSYKGHFVSQTEYICDWSGEISGQRLATH